MSDSPRKHDVILRPVAGDATRCVLVEVRTLEVIAGPMAVADGTARARAIAEQRRVTIWHEPIDDRGRPMGPPRKLYVPNQLA